jgi:hypothetical protein
MSTTITETENVITETKKKVVSLILTHQARIRCLLDMIIKGYQNEKKEGITEKINNNKFVIGMKNSINTLYTNTLNKIRKEDYAPHLYSYKKETEEEEKRFKNCSFLRLCLNKETGICIQLVYEGELDPGEGKGGRIYYITGKEDDKKQIGGVVDVKDKIKNNFVSAITLYKKKEGNTDAATNEIIEEIFTNINSGLNRLKLSNNIFKDVDEYVFYIGRHGQAEHNLKYATHLKTDTDVTQLGKDQAFRAGQNLSSVLKNNNENISYVFASDLMRTRQTIENILKGMNETQNKIYFPKEIIILPCSHELKYNSKGLCDKKPSSFSFKIGTKENDPKCSKTTHCLDNNITNPESDCNRIKMTIENSQDKIIRKISLNWDFYFEKNGNKIRKMDCSKTNMIQLAIEYINTSEKSVNKKKVVISNTNPVLVPVPVPILPQKTSIISDDCLAECLKDFFNKEIDSNYDINQIKSEPLFIYLKSYFNDVYNTNDLNKKSYIDFFEFVRKNNNDSNSSNPINQSERDFFDNKLIKCLEDHCINKKPVRPPPPPPPSPPPPPPDGSNNDLDENIEQENIEEKENIKIWVGLFNKNKGTFYKDFKDLTVDKNVFYKVMDELSIDPVNLNLIFNDNKISSDDFNNIISYLIDKIRGKDEDDENALQFMVYINNTNGELYNKIIKNLPTDIVEKITDIVEKINKKRGGKKTRKNRKAKKRFVKRTKRNHKKNKTRRGRRKIM